MALSRSHIFEGSSRIDNLMQEVEAYRVFKVAGLSAEFE
jgi:hypothetical protein